MNGANLYFHHNNRIAWLSIAKNACRSWAHVFDELGWEKQDLFQPTVDIEKLEFFGFLRWPSVRHTMGVIEYLEQTDQLALLHNIRFNRVLVSAVFDQHSYTVSQMVPADIIRRTTWFIMDQTYYNYEILVRNYLNYHGVEITIPVPRITDSRPTTREARITLSKLKNQYSEDHARLEKNFQDADAQLRNQHLALQSQWHRTGDPILQSVTLSEFYPWLPSEDWTQI